MDKDEWASWMLQEKTIEFFKWLENGKETAKEDWAQEMFRADNMQDWALKNAFALGGIKVINQILDKEFIPNE
jgi:hypothetical protein